MAKFNIPKHGEICWHELTARKINEAKPFYKKLFGWDLKQSKLTQTPYDEIHVNGEAVGGMMKINEQWGDGWEDIPAHWMTYIAVDDCDISVEKIQDNDGNICIPPFDVPGIGRFAVVQDPSGATFSIIQFVETENVTEE